MLQSHTGKGGRGKCLACNSEHKSAIDDSLVRGESMRALSKQYGISPNALKAHKRDHITPALVKVRTARIAAGARTLISRIEELAAQNEANMALAIEAKNMTQALAASREYRESLVLLGKVTGEINDRPTVSVNVQQSSEWQAMRSAVLGMFANDPKKAQELGRRLLILERGTTATDS